MAAFPRSRVSGADAGAGLTLQINHKARARARFRNLLGSSTNWQGLRAKQLFGELAQGCSKMIRVKCVAALAVAATFGIGAASAADLAPWPYTKAPALPYATYNWAGLYVGGHLGGSWTNESWRNTANTTAFGDLVPLQGFSQRGTGVFG